MDFAYDATMQAVRAWPCAASSNGYWKPAST
jgi:hypothetical protein